jgi:hypothetical protein
MSATDELAPWWRRHPERLGWELANFADLGVEARAEQGAAGPVLRTTLVLSDGMDVALRVDFPFEYPIMAPSVHVHPGLLGPPHEAGGLLCLFDDPRNQWHPRRDVAELVDGRVRTLLEGLLVRGELPADLEEQIPEVDLLSYSFRDGGVVFVPDPFWEGLPAEPGSGAIIMLGDEGRRRFLCFAEGYGFSTDLGARIGCEKGLALGRWVALPGQPTGYRTTEALLELARAACPRLLEPVPFADWEPTPPRWIAVNFLGPGVRAGERARRWGFLELTGEEVVPPAVVSGWGAQPLTLGERALRTPDLVGLEGAKIVLVGAGSLGSKVAIELAKAGCGAIVLIDHDLYEAGNAVRHELPPIHAGEGKAEATAHVLELLNPFCTVTPLATQIGIGAPPSEVLEAIARADLVVETTGERALTRLCERWCRITAVPLLSASLTRGSRGGDMVLLRAEYCFDCFLLAQQAGEIPAPARGKESAPVVPVGCGAPAFSGSGFDSSELASAVARMAVQATERTAYPALDYDWAVVDFLGQPRWNQGTLSVDPQCGHRR